MLKSDASSASLLSGRPDLRRAGVAGTMLVFAAAELTYPYQLAHDPHAEQPPSFELAIAVSTSTATAGVRPVVQDMLSGDVYDLPFTLSKPGLKAGGSDPSSGGART